VSHFAPLQRPEKFNTAMLAFVDEVYRRQKTVAGQMCAIVSPSGKMRDLSTRS
jgi:hypothetical protein